MSYRYLKLFGLIFVGVCMVISMTVQAAQSADVARVKLGAPLPLSGSTAAWGQQVQAILHIAEEEINQEGLGGNARLEILIKDDGADPNQSVLVVRQMINTDKVAAILGPLNSGPARVTVPLAKQTQTPFIEPSAAVPGLLEPARPWAVRIALINEEANYGPFGEWLKKNGIKRIATGFENSNPATKDAGSRQYVKGAQMAGVEVVNANDPVSWTIDMTDFSAVVTKLKSYKDIGALSLAPANEAPLLAKELQRQGVKLPVWSGNIFGDDQSLITRAGDSVEGWVGVSQNWSASPDPKMKALTDKFRARLKQETGKDEMPNTYALNYYYAAKATADVLRQSRPKNFNDVPAIRKLIMDKWNQMKNYKLLQGEITIGPDGEARRPLFILEVKNQKWALSQIYNP